MALNHAEPLEQLRAAAWIWPQVPGSAVASCIDGELSVHAMLRCNVRAPHGCLAKKGSTRLYLHGGPIRSHLAEAAAA